MSATVSGLRLSSKGSQVGRTGTITGDSSYPNGTGYVIPASKFRLSRLTKVLAGTAKLSSNAYVPLVAIQTGGKNLQVNLYQIPGSESVSQQQQSLGSKNNALLTGTVTVVTGTGPAIGDTLLQGTSTAAATVTAVYQIQTNQYLLTIGSVTSGPFDSTHTVTGTNQPSGNTYTFVPASLLLDTWTTSPVIAFAIGATSNTNQLLTQTFNQAPATNQFIVANGSQIVTLHSDGWTSISLTYYNASQGLQSLQEVQNGSNLSALSFTFDIEGS